MLVINKQATAILLLAGKGKRFNSLLPKQFTRIGEHELFLYAAKVLNNSPAIDSIIYVAPKGYEEMTESLLLEYHLTLKKEHYVITGGESRQESTYLALKFLKKHNISENQIVLIHDGDRPNLEEHYIEETIKGASEHDAAVIALKVSDSIAICKNEDIVSYLSREDVYALQTPQTFKFSKIFEAENRARKEEKNYTDEGSLLLGELGISPKIVIGDKKNLKITEPFDAKIFLAK